MRTSRELGGGRIDTGVGPVAIANWLRRVDHEQHEVGDVHVLADRVRQIVAATGDPSVTWVVLYSALLDLAAKLPALRAALTEAGVTELVCWDQTGHPEDTYDRTHLTAAGMRVVLATPGSA